MISKEKIEAAKQTLNDLEDFYNARNALDEVLTFSEACALINKAPNYFTELVKRGKLTAGQDFRMAGRIGLIKRSVALQYKSF